MILVAGAVLAGAIGLALKVKGVEESRARLAAWWGSANRVSENVQSPQRDHSVIERSRELYGPYTTAIQRDADSVLALMLAHFTGTAFVDARIRADKMRQKAGDFEAVPPPADLAVIHAQMVSALQRLALVYEGRAERMMSIEARSPLVSLDLAWDGPLSVYNDARDRAKKVLAGHGIDLPERN